MNDNYVENVNALVDKTSFLTGIDTLSKMADKVEEEASSQLKVQCNKQNFSNWFGKNNQNRTRVKPEVLEAIVEIYQKYLPDLTVDHLLFEKPKDFRDWLKKFLTRQGPKSSENRGQEKPDEKKHLWEKLWKRRGEDDCKRFEIELVYDRKKERNIGDRDLDDDDPVQKPIQYFTIGSSIRMCISGTPRWYVFVLIQQPSGLKILIPKKEQHNQLTGDGELYIPEGGDAAIPIKEPPGTHKILAILRDKNWDSRLYTMLNEDEYQPTDRILRYFTDLIAFPEENARLTVYGCRFVAGW